MKRLLVTFTVATALAAFDPAAAQDAPTPDPATIERGRTVFQYWCSACHGDGTGRPGTASLAYKYRGTKSALLEQRTDLTPELTRFFVRNGISVMPFFRKVEIGDSDLDALAAYLARNIRP